MLSFMLLAAPRSGTAWAANWLTTDTTLCLHEPLTRWAKEELDHVTSDRSMGVACTALALWPDFVNAHPARKVILHREPREVRESMERLGISGGYDFTALDRIEGMHLDWRQLFDNPGPIYSHLLGKSFDAERHFELAGMNVQNAKLIHQLRREGARALAHG
jgi:hypothetical protein